MRVHIPEARRFVVGGPLATLARALLLPLLLGASLASVAACSSPASSGHRRPGAPPSTIAGPGGTNALPPTTQAQAPSSRASGREGVPAFTHIFVVVMENLSDQGALATPSIAALAHRYAFASSYYAVSHPSLPNYLALVSGSTWGISSDCTSCGVSGPNLARQLDAAGISWGAYLEAMPAACFSGPEADGGLYAKKHNPFIYFDDVRTNPRICNHLQPLSSLTTILSQTPSEVPRFVWVTPDMCHDGHDCSAATAGSWLSSFVSTVTASPAWQGGGVMFIVWDEGSDDSSMDPTTGATRSAGGGGHILALVVAPGLPNGEDVNVTYDHYSLLRTVEDSLSLPLLANASAPGVKPLAAFWSGGSASASAG